MSCQVFHLRVAQMPNRFALNRLNGFTLYFNQIEGFVAIKLI